MLLLKMLKVNLFWRVRGPRISAFYLVSVITLNHIKKWFSMHFLKLLIWFLMLRASLIGFLILGNRAPHGTLSLGGDWKVLCTNPLFHGSASVTKSEGKCCREASTAYRPSVKTMCSFLPHEAACLWGSLERMGCNGRFASGFSVSILGLSPLFVFS